MSTEESGRGRGRTSQAGCRSLGEYVAALVADLGTADLPALERLRRVVGSRQARIGLDDEVVEVEFQPVGLVVKEPRADSPVDGEGTTDRTTVMDLLDGYAEVVEAILDGRLEVQGDPDAVIRMFQAIEILLDAAARAPHLQKRSTDFRADPCRDPVSRTGPPGQPMASGFPHSRPAGELVLLERLGLLP